VTAPAGRTAVIDIGTNTLLLLVVERGADDKLVAVRDLCRFGRLGQGLDASGRLADEAIARSLDICREYARAMSDDGVARRVVIGTQALREAANAAAFVGPAEEILGARIEVIEGAREADLAFRAVAATFPELGGTPYVVVDVGGGSTEIIAVSGAADAAAPPGSVTRGSAKVVSAVSVKIGAVRLRERHLKSDPPTPDEVRALIAGIDDALSGVELPRGAVVVGTAGTATTMASVQLGLHAYDPDRVTGLRLEAPAVDAQLAKLLSLTTAQRRRLPGMVVERADVLPAGVAIFSRVMARAGAPALIVCDRGIRWGVAHELLA
jgi:exopolyphosphatase / guanosine-5'-triphosphate,3'-diphosphate pyrophosphatase